jgi:catechol 2,3-dioxygenase-like lactoylglutathione lyase family enzyme
MKQQVSFITLGVNNLEKMKAFYTEKFGWAPVKDSDGLVLFPMNGCMLALYAADALAEELHTVNNGQGFKPFVLAINLGSEQEVNEVFDQLRQKGVAILREPEKTIWGGYRGYIADIENNYWEFVYNPGAHHFF